MKEMTKEQARLLREVLCNAVTNWNGVSHWPMSLDVMIQLEIDNENKTIYRMKNE